MENCILGDAIDFMRGGSLPFNPENSTNYILDYFRNKCHKYLAASVY